jgi:hypothetical protein
MIAANSTAVESATERLHAVANPVAASAALTKTSS